MTEIGGQGGDGKHRFVDRNTKSAWSTITIDVYNDPILVMLGAEISALRVERDRLREELIALGFA